MSKFFQGGALIADELATFAMGAQPSAAMLESAKSQAELAAQPVKPAEPEKPAVVVSPPGSEMTLEQAHQVILEAVAAAVKSDNLSDAAQAVFDWADGSDNSYDSLDGFAQSLSGIDEDDTDPTDDQLNVYYDVLGNMANFFVAMGADDDDIESLFDDEDDDIAATLATQIKGMDADQRAELVSAYSLSGNSAMTEALIKVVRGGKWLTIRKPFKHRRRTAAQRMALKLAQRKSHSAQAKLHRAKSMKIRAKRLGK